VGQQLTLTDHHGRPHGIVEITRVRIIPLHLVGDDVARDEGEGFANAAEWRRDHEAFWTEVAELVRAEAGDPAKRLKDLERENSTLKRLLADAELEKAALKEIARGNFYARNADATRAAVHHVIVTMKVSERFACRVTGQNRTTQRRLRCRLRSPVSVDDAGLLGLADGCAPFRTA
jgi:putative transposase